MQKLSPPSKSKGHRLNTDSKCMRGEGKEHLNSRCENKTRGTARGTVCVQSMPRIERSAKMVGLVSRQKDPKTKGQSEAEGTEIIK